MRIFRYFISAVDVVDGRPWFRLKLSDDDDGSDDATHIFHLVWEHVTRQEWAGEAGSRIHHRSKVLSHLSTPAPPQQIVRSDSCSCWAARSRITIPHQSWPGTERGNILVLHEADIYNVSLNICILQGIIKVIKIPWIQFTVSNIEICICLWKKQ